MKNSFTGKKIPVSAGNGAPLRTAAAALASLLMVCFCLTGLAEEAANHKNAGGNIPIDMEHFPCLYPYVLETIDTDQDGFLSEDEANSVTELSTLEYDWVLSNMKGIEYFPHLRRLEIASIYPGRDIFWDFTLDVSQNRELTELSVVDTDIKKLDISQNTALKMLEVTYNYNLTTLDISHNKALEKLYCSGNSLKTIKFGNNTALKTLSCSMNSFKSLDVSACPKLVTCVQKGKRTENLGDLRPWKDGAYDISVWKYQDCSLSVDAHISVKAGSTTAKPLTDGPLPSNAYVNDNIGLVYAYDNYGNATILKSTSKNITEITIPDHFEEEYAGDMHVTKIASGAFRGLTKLKTVSIGKNVKTIGTGAFANCKNLTKVTGMAGVTKIGDSAFQGCAALSSLTIGKNVSSIGKSAFEGCKALKKIVFKTKKLKASAIGASAFKNTPAKAVILCPASVLKQYKKILLKRGVSKKAKFTK